MTFRGVFRDRCNLELLSCIEAAYIRTRGLCIGGEGKCYVAGSRTLWTVHQSSGVYVLDSGQRSSVTVNHPFPPPSPPPPSLPWTAGWRQRGGGGGGPREDRTRTTLLPGSTCRCPYRMHVCANNRATCVVHLYRCMTVNGTLGT